MVRQFKIFKEGTTTKGKITIISKEGEPFDRTYKVHKFIYLGYKVYDLEDNEITN